MSNALFWVIFCQATRVADTDVVAISQTLLRHFSLVIDTDGGTHAFGNCEGALGVGDEDERVLPTRVAFEDGA